MNRNSKFNKKAVSLFLSLAILMSLLTGAIPAASAQQSDAAVAPTVTITVPSTMATAQRDETTIAPYRDFYIMGNVEGIPDNAKMDVYVRNADGATMRHLYRNGITTQEDYNFQWMKERWNSEGTAEIHMDLDPNVPADQALIAKTLMPDFIYTGTPESMGNYWNKCAFSSQRFTAEVISYPSPGSYYIEFQDEYKQPLYALGEGDYTITVAFTSPDGRLLASDSLTLHMAVTPNKVLSRFSPSSHLTKVMEAAENNRVYLDAFPGVTSANHFIPDWPENVNGFIEMYTRWRWADSQEYEGGTIKFHSYNISDQSATYNAELGKIQYLQDVENRIGSVWHYDIGEPRIANASGHVVREGTLVPFALGSKLALTRATVSAYIGQQDENSIDLDVIPMLNSYYDFEDAPIPITSNGEVSISGVVAPIQVAQNEVQYNNKTGWYDISNRIASVEFNYFYGEELLYTDNVPVECIRTGGEYKTSATSIFEFSHVININNYPKLRNKIAYVFVNAYDVHGNLVPNSEGRFMLDAKI